MLVLMFPPSLGHIAASARAELLTQWFQRHVGVEISIDVAPDYEALHRAIVEGRIDLAWAPPIVCASVQRSCLAILKAVRGGRSAYRSALIVRHGEIHSLEELRGARAAWVDRLSTGGYLLPTAHLRSMGHDPDELLGEQFFVGSYGRALRGLLDREADVASIYVHSATHEAAQTSLRDLLRNDASRLCAVDFTREAPSDGLVVIDRPAHTDSHQVLDQI
ncbi:MAG: PhnD/SsuA/transferrin family substrate-binding protein, partial [Myxococcales bacterium]|nr:PhnD/SsuA/transferrin family substrate-binding protein [Myxococcales bacterium]